MSFFDLFLLAYLTIVLAVPELLSISELLQLSYPLNRSKFAFEVTASLIDLFLYVIFVIIVFSYNTRHQILIYNSSTSLFG